MHGAESGRARRGQRRAVLLFEAAVMGGVPAVKMMREAMAGDRRCRRRPRLAHHLHRRHAAHHGRLEQQRRAVGLAEHGAELAALAEANNAPLLFEAAVMGGTPAVKMLREAMVGDEVEAVAGILNGTCNYILTQMEETGRLFAGGSSAEAQAARLCRGRSDYGCRRVRRGAQDLHPGGAGVRLRAQLRRRRDRRGRRRRADRHPPRPRPRLSDPPGGLGRRGRDDGVTGQRCIRRWRLLGSSAGARRAGR